ncbi:MAG: hypothetical protein WCV88_05760 [Patescibacteria group bacterium]
MRKIFLGSVMAIFLGWSGVANAAYSRDVVSNGDFEANLDAWSCTNCSAEENIVYNEDYLTHRLALGKLNTFEEAKQTVDLSAASGKITFDFTCDFITTDSLADDYFTYTVNNTTTGQSYITDTIYPANNVTTCGTILDLSAYAGQSVDIVFSVNNDGTNLTTAEIDDVVVWEKSYSSLTGRVFDQHYNKLKQANVIVQRYNGDELWRGKTNDNGIFKAADLQGHEFRKARIIFKYQGSKEIIRRYIVWGQAYNRTFHLETI